MADHNNERWNDDNRWAGEADYGQRRDEERGYREGRYADGRHDPGRYGESRSYGDEHSRSHPLRGAPRVNQDIGYGSGSLATGAYASNRAPGSFSAHGGSGGAGGYGDGYGAYGGPANPRSRSRRFVEGEQRSYQGGSRAGGGRDDHFGGEGAFATDELLDRQARGEDPSFWGRMFGRDRNEGQHRGRGPRNYKRDDKRILDDVNDRLTDDSWLDAQDINVEVKDCEVTLTGTVSSREDKRHAEIIAEGVSGVDHVQNNLRVARRDDQDAKTTPLPMV